MKKFKRLIVAVMAMTMMFGMFTVSASAAEDPGKMYIVGFNNWEEFMEMTANGDGTYSYTVELVAGENKFKFTTEQEWPAAGKTAAEVNVDGGVTGPDFKYTADVAGTYVVTLDFNKVIDGGDATHFNGNGDVNADGSAVSVVASNNAGAGVSTPVVAVAVVAVIALAGVAICMKKRTVTE